MIDKLQETQEQQQGEEEQQGKEEHQQVEEIHQLLLLVEEVVIKNTFYTLLRYVLPYRNI